MEEIRGIELKCTENKKLENVILVDDNNTEYLLPELELKDNKSSNDSELIYQPYIVSHCFLGFNTFEIIKHKASAEKLKDKKNSIQVFNFYFKKRAKYRELHQIYNRSKFQYFYHYIFNLTKKYVVKDLRKILIYNMAIFFAQKLSMMIFKLIKKKRLANKK